MIRELADYEKEPDAVHATEESLLSTLSLAESSEAQPSSATEKFSQGYAKTLILRLPAPSSATSASTDAGKGGQVAGMALYFTNYSTWRGAPGIYLEDLFVRPAYRGNGYGTLLIKRLCVESKRIGGKRVEWCCLKWNEKSLAFYRSLGAVEMKDWVTLRVDGEVLDKLAAQAEEESRG